jgi:hypothetical protein
MDLCLVINRSSLTRRALLALHAFSLRQDGKVARSLGRDSPPGKSTDLRLIAEMYRPRLGY